VIKVLLSEYIRVCLDVRIGRVELNWHPKSNPQGNRIEHQINIFVCLSNEFVEMEFISNQFHFMFGCKIREIRKQMVEEGHM
jgi:hypothetical protein